LLNVKLGFFFAFKEAKIFTVKTVYFDTFEPCVLEGWVGIKFVVALVICIDYKNACLISKITNGKI